MKRSASLTDKSILIAAIGQAFLKLDPRKMARNPVMFVVEIVASLTTLLLVRDIAAHHAQLGFSIQINLWLWFTLLFANFAEAVAEGRGKAQAAPAARRWPSAWPISARKSIPRSPPNGWSGAIWFWWKPARSSPPTVT